MSLQVETNPRLVLNGGDLKLPQDLLDAVEDCAKLQAKIESVFNKYTLPIVRNSQGTVLVAVSFVARYIDFLVLKKRSLDRKIDSLILKKLDITKRPTVVGSEIHEKYMGYRNCVRRQFCIDFLAAKIELEGEHEEGPNTSLDDGVELQNLEKESSASS